MLVEPMVGCLLWFRWNRLFCGSGCLGSGGRLDLGLWRVRTSRCCLGFVGNILSVDHDLFRQLVLLASSRRLETRSIQITSCSSYCHLGTQRTEVDSKIQNRLSLPSMCTSVSEENIADRKIVL